MTTKTTLTALALAAAAFTTLSVGSASANFLQNLPGHGPVVTGPVQGGNPLHEVFPVKGGTTLLPPAQNGNPLHEVFPVKGGTTLLPPPVGKPPVSNPPVGKPPVGTPPIGTPKQGGGGTVVSCHPGTGCTVTGGDRDRDHDHDHDYDRDHDRDHDHDHYRDWYRWYHDWSYSYGYYGYPRWNWTLPPVYSSYYQTPVESCSYEYKWASVYQPGYGLRRVVEKVCAGS